MNTKLKRTILATAITMLFGASAAYAQESRPNSNDPHQSNDDTVQMVKKVRLTSDISVSGDPTVSGNINVDSAAIAIVNNAQRNGANVGMNENLTNSASAGDGAGQDSSGNIGLNIAAGDNNQQDNAAALSAADASFTFGMADAEVFVDQSGTLNSTINHGVTNGSSIDGSSFSNASGNIGANIASGNNNQQKNAMAASVATTSFAQATISSDQQSGHNEVANSGYIERFVDTVQVGLSGWVSGSTSSQGSGSYSGSEAGSYSGSTSSSTSGYADQMGNVYPDVWANSPNDDPTAPHPTNGDLLGHIDLNTDTQGGSDLNGDGGALAFGIDTSSEGSESGSYRGSESGSLGFTEMGSADLYANLTGSVVTTRWVIHDATNTARLGGDAFRNASGNIGINIASGTGNQQANSLAMAVAQPSTPGGGTGGGGGAEQ